MGQGIKAIIRKEKIIWGLIESYIFIETDFLKEYSGNGSKKFLNKSCS